METITTQDEIQSTHKTLVYTVSELAEVLKIGKNAAYELARSKGFPVIQVGTKKRIPQKGLEEWLQKEAMKNNQ